MILEIIQIIIVLSVFAVFVGVYTWKIVRGFVAILGYNELLKAKEKVKER